MVALYQSRDWLHKRLYRDKRTVEQIANECNTSRVTIYKYMKRFGFVK